MFIAVAIFQWDSVSGCGCGCWLGVATCGDAIIPDLTIDPMVQDIDRHGYGMSFSCRCHVFLLHLVFNPPSTLSKSLTTQ